MRETRSRKGFSSIITALVVISVLLLSTGMITAEDTIGQNPRLNEELGAPVSEEQTEFPKSRLQNDTENLDISLKWVTDDPKSLVDMHWRGINTDSISQKYSLKISASNIDFDPGEITIIIPKTLLHDRSGKPLLPSTISLPLHGFTANDMPFSYGPHIEKGVEYIEIKNYDTVHAGTNFEIEVGYSFLPSHFADMSVGKLIATCTVTTGGSEPIRLVSNEITYTLDTHIRAGLLLKNGRIMREWDAPLLGELPKGINFGDYRWGLYTIRALGDANLNHYLEFVERPQNNGRVVRIVKYFENDQADLIQDIVDHEDGHTSFRTKTYTNVISNVIDVRFYIAVAYPADELQNGDQFENIIDVYFVNADIPTEKPGLTTSSTLTWSDYSFSYTGDTVETDKLAYISKNYSKQGSLSFLRTGNDTELERWQIDTVIQGYEHKDYTIEVYDDFLDWKTPAGSFVQMGPDDYEHFKATITGEFYRIDRNSGAKTYYEQNADSPPVELWAKIGDGDFELIDSIKASHLDWLEDSTHGGEKWTVNLPRGTTQIKVRAEGLNDYAAIKIQLLTRLFGSSPRAQEWFDTIENLDSIIIRNHNAVKMYDKNGVWINRAEEKDYSDTNNDYVQAMIKRDHDTYGDYIHRDRANYTIRDLYRNSVSIKTVGTIRNDPIKRQVTIPYALGGLEYYNNLTLDQSKTLLSCDEFKNFGRNSAVFYDLLPEGSFLNKDKDIVVFDISRNKNTVTSEVETIENYRGSGRQMVIIRVAMKNNIRNRNESKSSVHVGTFSTAQTLYNNVLATGFTVQIETIVPWENVSFCNNKKNLMAYQVDDQLLIGGYSDKGEAGIVRNVKDRNGVSLFYNLRGGENGANEVVGDAKNTLYTDAAPTINVATSMSEGLTKIVKADTPDAVFSKAIYVDTNKSYIYRFTINNSLDGKVSDVILFDSLETADYQGKGSGWRGSFDSVDDWYAKLLGIDPVIYYSVDENAAFFTTKDIDKNSVPVAWTTKIPDDKNDIRAIAIDLSRRSDGTLFEFAKNQSIYIEVNLTAPKDYLRHTATYNKASYYSKFVPAAGGIASDSTVTTTAVSVELKGGILAEPPEINAPTEIKPQLPLYHVVSAIAKTGDNSKITFWMIVTIISILCIILIQNRKREDCDRK